MATIQIAIKMGSSYTSIYKEDEGIVLYEPSYVAYAGVGKNREIKAIGEAAKRILGRTDESTTVISPVSSGVVDSAELTTVMLKYFISKVIPKSLFKPNIRAVVCTPLGLVESEFRAFEKVCFDAGISEVILIPSVLCGAIGYNINVSSPTGALVVNIGGGSTDIAVICNDTIISGTNISVGGIQMDLAIENLIAEKFGIIIGSGVAERVKKEIGSLYKKDKSNTEICGVDYETKFSKIDVVNSYDIYEVLDFYYNKIAVAVQGVINSCPPEIVSDISNEGMFLFGGGSLLTGTEQYFKSKLNIKVTLEEETNAIDVIGAGKLLSVPKKMRDIIATL